MAIYTNFEAMDHAKNQLDAIKARYIEEMQVLEKMVREVNEHDWQGPDAEKFITTTNEKLKNVREQYDEFLKSINREIEDNKQKFKAVQQRNMNMLS